MAKVEGLNKLLAQLAARDAEASSAVGVAATVGFQTSYALYVHEDMTARHPVGQAKFLEQPARVNAPEYSSIVVEAIQKGLPLRQALMLAALRLQRDAQQLTPVDTSTLKNSATTTLEDVKE